MRLIATHGRFAPKWTADGVNEAASPQASTQAEPGKTPPDSAGQCRGDSCRATPAPQSGGPPPAKAHVGNGFPADVPVPPPLALGMHVSIMEKGEDRSAEVSILHNGKGRGGPERGRGCPPSQPAAPSAPERHTPQVVAAHSTLHVPARAVFRHGETLGMVAVARNAHGEAVRAPKISVSAPCVSN
jgi:hypothetical protein